jgi:hypothetical protein
MAVTESGSGPRGIFICYRRVDVPDAARLLYERLSEAFGEEVVYLDVAEQEPGIDWEARLRERGSQAGAFLAVIGPRWLSELKVKSAAAKSSGDVDVVRREVEWALREWPGAVIPVLVNGAQMPADSALPRSIKGLRRPQALEIRHESFDTDVQRLIEHLKSDALTGATRPHLDTAPNGNPVEPRVRRNVQHGTSDVPMPSESHYAEVIGEMLYGHVVPWLGSCVRGALPDARLLAARLAERFGDLELTSPDLAEVAQHISTRKGESRLFAALGELIEHHSEPIPIHRFLAGLPGALRRHELSPRYQLILTTNYDRALERAFEDVGEPFDYAIYTASTGRFMHFPWGELDALPVAVEIDDPGRYIGFPIGDDYELERTVIVKLHGAPQVIREKGRARDEYVITENEHIDYLATQDIGDCVPVQIVEKLNNSSWLFLGYTLREWSARLLLRRICRGREMTENHWAVENAPDEFESLCWRDIPRVRLFDASPSEYAEGLRLALSDLLRPASTTATGA